MTKNLQGHILRFVFFVLLQVLVLNNIHLGGYLNPYPYVLFLLILPPKTNTLTLLLIGFALGLSIDIFSNTGGIHAAGCVMVSYLRPRFIRIVTSRPLDEIDKINLYTFGVGNFIMFAGLTVFVHHFIIFSLDLFRLSETLATISKAFSSSIFSMILIVLHQLVTAKRRNEF
jgi:rod shape-determining protein MreD